MPSELESAPAPPAWALFLDFDGTITDLDTFDVLVRRFAGDAAWHASESGLREGTATLRDVLQRQASYVRGSLADVAALLRGEIRIDPGFVPLVAACRSRAIPVTIVSSGLAPIIRGRLQELGLADLPVVANDVDADAGGWRIRFRDEVANGTDKAAVLRAASAAGSSTIFVGDGRSDFEAALAADLRFAKRAWPLASYLRELGAPFSTFADLAEVAASLERAGVLATENEAAAAGLASRPPR